MFKKWSAILIALLLMAEGFHAQADSYVETARDTLYVENATAEQPEPLEDEYALLCQTGSMRYWWRADRNILAIQDARNGYIWKSGLDLPLNAEADDWLKQATDEEKAAAPVRKEYKLNDTYIGIGNSMLVVEYFDKSNSIKSLGSGSPKGVEADFSGEGNEWTLRMQLVDAAIQVDMHLTLTENGFVCAIGKDDIAGEGREKLAAIRLFPYMGAAGGAWQYYNPETEKFDRVEYKSVVDGYAFVPDGSGALIRFRQLDTSVSAYTGELYGEDRSESTYYSRKTSGVIAPESPGMAVFGVAHGSEAAFVSWAEECEEYSEIVCCPAGNSSLYTTVYPRYVYNREYYQVYNQKGDGYFSLMQTLNPVAIRQTYQFLAAGDDLLTPDYIGMANAYRAYLRDNHLLPDVSSILPSVRLDFMMADIKKGIVGYDPVVMTTVDNVAQMLGEMADLGVDRITGNLVGWKKGGITGANPGTIQYDGAVGTEKEIRTLMENAWAKGVRLALAQDYLNINRIMLNYTGNAAQHLSTWHILDDYSQVRHKNAPALEGAYASPQRSAQWLETAAEDLEWAPALTISGISSRLLGSFDRNGACTRSDAKSLAMNAVEKASQNHDLLLEKPNAYLLKWTKAYLNAPVFTSSYLCETDTVPFVEMVLHGTMELYAPYVNFSLYTQEDMLRMVDYNVMPSFMLTRRPSYLLAYTNSSDYYSTEYERYKEQIVSAWELVVQTLDNTAGMAWVDREVAAPGVVINSYRGKAGGGRILINYTEEDVEIDGLTLAALSARYVEGMK